MQRKDNVVKGRFRSGRGRAPGLPPELTALLAADKKRRRWRRYLPLWAGSLTIGLLAGAGPSLIHRAAPAFAESLSGNAAAPLVDQTVAASGEWIASSESEEREAAIEDQRRDPAEAVQASFGFCHTGGGANCVVDGDTIWIQGEKIRIADIDAPETHDYRCSEEKALGDRATQRLIELVNSGSITMEAINRDEDRYGRKLRVVLVDGASVGEVLVSEGLARPYDGGRKPWC